MDFKLETWANTIDPLVAEDFELRGSCLRWPAISHIYVPPHTLTGSGYSHRLSNLPPRSLLCHEEHQSQVAFSHAVELPAELGNQACIIAGIAAYKIGTSPTDQTEFLYQGE